MLSDDELGRVMRIARDADDTFLRTMGSLALDALLVPGLAGGALSVRRTLGPRRIATVPRKPLLVSVEPEIDATSLEVLRDYGVTRGVAGGALLQRPCSRPSRVSICVPWKRGAWVARRGGLQVILPS